MSLALTGFLSLLIGTFLYFFIDTLAEWTVVGWYRLSMGKKLDYLSTLRAYF